jgi:hypothetical protein
MLEIRRCHRGIVLFQDYFAERDVRHVQRRPEKNGKIQGFLSIAVIAAPEVSISQPVVDAI